MATVMMMTSAMTTKREETIADSFVEGRLMDCRSPFHKKIFVMNTLGHCIIKDS